MNYDILWVSDPIPEWGCGPPKTPREFQILARIPLTSGPFYPRQHHAPQVMCLVPPRCPPHTEALVGSPRLASLLLICHYQWQVPTLSSLGSFHSLEGLTELRETHSHVYQ